VHRRQLLFTILKSIAVGLIAGRSSSAQDDLDPVKLMRDTHKVLVENAFVRVIEGRVPAGGFEPKHRHPHCVLANLADFDVEVRAYPDEKWNRMGAGPPSPHHERGCPTFRGFRKVGTTDLGFLFIRLTAAWSRSRYHRPWRPSFENHEPQGSLHM
jgi:hypothetical protein